MCTLVHTLCAAHVSVKYHEKGRAKALAKLGEGTDRPLGMEELGRLEQGGGILSRSLMAV